MKPYTYIIKHKPTGRLYYGYRGANTVEAQEDLWNRYYTSSPIVKELIEQDGVDSFDFEIRRVFETKEQAVSWEQKALRRLKVLHSDKWINQNIAGYIIPTKESRRKISEYHMGKPKTEEHKRKLSEAQKGNPKVNSKNKTPEYRAKMSKLKSGKNNPMYGKGCSEERRRRISEANKGRPAHNKGKPMSEEQKQKLRETLRKKRESKR